MGMMPKTMTSRITKTEMPSKIVGTAYVAIYLGSGFIIYHDLVTKEPAFEYWRDHGVPTAITRVFLLFVAGRGGKKRTSLLYVVRYDISHV